MQSSNDIHHPYPQYNWIEITKDLVIFHYMKPSIELFFKPESQYHIFTWLEQHGFMGEKAITW